ncbi:TIGR00659 family protein [Desulfonispora thiosulfatigenes DSM 11270]|uniref:TIGR00659 family protein n=1 Tax=Desulfonispora thiosulfatigenes DSM 11270 TaxID=656914 RepID=A0A1W1UIM1_DESTI|nr:LrgB family protein [Desulfonispora thiosulfatigenes]SMB80882.1 TIGR00659 family protein [Desulfonispora thiosulfatigenes DSM 11270]
MKILIILYSIVITILSYWFSRKLNQKYPSPFTNIVFLSTAIIIITLLLSGLSFEDYTPGKNIMTFLLGPATVALAVPLYKNITTLKKYFFPILTGIGVGVLSTVTSMAFLSNLLNFSEIIKLSLLTKSVTVPIAVEITKIIGGDPALTAAFVVATGTGGSMIAFWLLDKFKITNPICRGLAIGTTAHGQGTAIAIQEGEVQGAMSGIAMALSAIFTSFITPFFVTYFV